MFPTDGTGLELERRAAEWAFEITPQVGRLYVAAHAGKASDDGPESLMLSMTARGPLKSSDGSAGLTAGLARGQEMAVEAFERSASPDARARWGKPL